MTKYEGTLYRLAKALAAQVDSDLPQPVVESYAQASIITMLDALQLRLNCASTGMLPYNAKVKYKVELN